MCLVCVCEGQKSCPPGASGGGSCLRSRLRWEQPLNGEGKACSDLRLASGVAAASLVCLGLFSVVTWCLTGLEGCSNKAAPGSPCLPPISRSEQTPATLEWQAAQLPDLHPPVQ